MFSRAFAGTAAFAAANVGLAGAPRLGQEGQTHTSSKPGDGVPGVRTIFQSPIENFKWGWEHKKTQNSSNSNIPDYGSTHHHSSIPDKGRL